VDFDEDAVDPGRDSRRGHRLDELRLAGRHAVAGPRELQAVRHVVHDRVAERAQQREGAHVDDEVVVPEAVAAFGHEDPRVAGLDDLVDRVAHVSGREELPLLDVHHAAGARRGHEQIGLA
jgi:hypothetical protein